MSSLGQVVFDVANRSDEEYDPSSIVDIITFAESSWGLGQRLFPVQRVILKAHYGLALDDNPYGFDLSKPVPEDHPHYHPDLVDGRGLYKWRVPISGFRRENWEVVSEADYLRKLYDEGRCNIKEVKPGEERREMVLAIGRRSGKTYLSACIAAYETYKLIKKKDPHGYYGISKSNPIQLISVATDLDQAGLLYADVSGHFKNCGFFDKFTANNTQTYARFQTPADIESSCRYKEDPKAAQCSLKVTFKSCVAKGLRGAGNMIIILDELAHFTNNKSQSSAREIYKSISPSKSAFAPKDEWGMPIGDVESRMIAISSPMGRDGFFYEHFMFGMKGGEGTEGMLCIQAPTWEVNPSIPASELKKEYAKDANSFFTEYGAEFSDRTRGWIEDEDDLLACVDPTLRPLTQAPARRPHFMGIDFGIVNDATAVAIGHIANIGGQDKVVLDYMGVMQAGEGEYEHLSRLDLEDVADWIKALSRRFYIERGLFDQWAGPIIEQSVHKRGLNQIESKKMSKSEVSNIWKNFKELMFEERLVLYNWPLEDGEELCPYLKELTTLQATQQSKNIIEVEAPNIKGMHDDMSDALVRMVWLATEHMGSQKYVTGSNQPNIATQRANGAHLARMRARRRARRSGSHPDRMVPKGRKGGRGRKGRSPYISKRR